MKNTLFYLLLICLSIRPSILAAQDNAGKQQKWYGNLWTEVDSLLEIQKANKDSILCKLDRINTIAKKHDDVPIITKSIYYKAVLISNSRLKGRYDGIAFIEAELNQSDGIIVPLLQSILADFYKKLAEDYDYSKCQHDSITTDIKQWSRQQLNNKVNELLTLSIKNEQTKFVDIRGFKDFFDGNAYFERPTLFDYLSYYAIDNYIRPYNRSRLKFKPSYYSVDNFLSLKVPEDTILATYYNLLKFHQQQNNTRAFVHAEILRLKELPRIFDIYWKDNQDSVYVLSLEKLNSKYAGTDAQVEIIAELVSFYWKESTSGYSDRIPIDLLRCKQLLDKALQRKLNSPAYEKCENLKKNLLASFLKLEIKQEYYPQTKISAEIFSRNVSSIDVTIKGMDSTYKSKIHIPIIKKYCYQYNTITFSDGLPLGKYDLFIHGGIDTDTIKIPIVVTNVLSYGVTLNDSLIGVVVDRKTGVSLPKLPVFIDEPNRPLKNDTIVLSNDEGFYSYKSSYTNSTVDVKIDSVKASRILSSQVDEFNRFLVFTDRSIYRPGQTVYYKATIVNVDRANNFYRAYGRSPHLILSNGRTLYDQNPVYLNSLDGKSMIVHGKFLIPNDAALGKAQFDADYNFTFDQKTIHIEEYKRPSFEVTIDSVRWNSLKKMSSVIGNAQGYAGYVVDSAKVVISIKSPLDTTYTCYTNDKGVFKCDIKTNEYYCTLDVSVTSKSGETQSNKFREDIVGPLSVELNISATISIPNPSKLSVYSRNGLASGQIAIEKLVEGKYIQCALIPFNAQSSSNISIERGIHSCGNYRISFVNNGKIMSSKLITVIAKEEIRYIYLNKQVYTIGDTACLTIRTPKDAQSVLFIEKNGKLWKNILIDTTFYQFKFPITRFEQLAYRVMMTNNFETTESSEIVNVLDNSTKLKIELLTYRNKLLPNSEEKWTMRVTDYLGKPVVADVTAAMYDASLDSYYPNVWLNNGLFFSNRIFSNCFYLRNNYWKETNSAWSEESRIWYSSLLKWDLRPQKGSSELIDASDSRGIMEYAYCMVEKSGLTEECVNSCQFKAPNSKSILADFSARKNIGESLFFYPEIKTDSLGYANINFTMNEALTRWRLMLFALSKDMQYGFSDSYTISQKPLMVKPNPPRFLREGDTCYFVSTIINMSDSVIKGKAQVEFFDLKTNQTVNADFLDENNIKDFDVQPHKTLAVRWKIHVPIGDRVSVGYRVKAACDVFTDGEENALPILSNRELFTESFSFDVAARSNDKYTFKKLKNNSSNTAHNHLLSLNLVKNPVWEVLSALPYLMTYPHGCSEQKMSKLCANIIALTLLEENSDIRSVFDSWRGRYKNSPLDEGSKLNAVLTEESPWFKDNLSQGNREAVLASQFSTEQLRLNISTTIQDIKMRQLPTGGFSWMPNGAYDNYITQLIVEQILHLKYLGVNVSKYGLDAVLVGAWKACDTEFSKEYFNLKKDIEVGKVRYEANHLSPLIIHQLYTRSLITDDQQANTSDVAYQYYLEQSLSYYDQFSISCQGMIALALYRSGDTLNATKIMDSLEHNAHKDESLGMFWDYAPFYWYTQPIESQAIMIESFHEIKNNKEIDALLKKWLLKNKEANSWTSTKATTAAIYSLMMVGEKLPVKNQPFEITIGKDELYINEKESNTGSVYKQWMDSDIDKSKATIKIVNPNGYQTWGSMNWQYIENIDKATATENESLSLHKTMYKEVAGQRLQLNDSSIISVGDKITIRLEIETKRDLEYLFLKDYRCSGFEPGKELSGYVWDKDCSYFKSIRDVSTQFFFDRLNRGKYTIEYTLYANLNGSYSNGYASIESMYAPSIRSRTESMHITIKEGK